LTPQFLFDLPDEDAPVGDDVLLYRLVPTTWCEVIDGEWEFQSGAFDNASALTIEDCPDDMSVVLSDTLGIVGREPDDLPHETSWTDDADGWGVAVLKATFARDEEAQEILRSPRDDEPAHGDVRGKKNPKRRKRLKKHARWVVRPKASPPIL